MSNKLIVIDMQNDFIDGSLANEAAARIVPEMAEFIKGFDEVIFTRDTHHDNYLSTAEGRNLPIPHCIEGTKGWEVREELVNAAHARAYVNKPTFGYIDWNLDLHPGDEITLVGTCTDICVVSNALILKAKYPENRISVVGHLCAGLTEEKHKAALEVMRSCQVEVVE